MKTTLKIGDSHVHKFTVTEDKTVPHLYPESPEFRAMPKVFATGFLVGLVEWACIEALKPHLDPGEGSVGTAINISHLAATPPGMQVTVTVTCTAVSGRGTEWRVEARDERDLHLRGNARPRHCRLGSISGAPRRKGAVRRDLTPLCGASDQSASEGNGVD
jgi:fluoroacetyl-CoA thioesterase